LIQEGLGECIYIKHIMKMEILLQNLGTLGLETGGGEGTQDVLLIQAPGA
jgi:hypothetical protein